MKNSNPFSLTLGSIYCLEVLQDGGWHQVPTVEPADGIVFTWPDVAFAVAAGGSAALPHSSWTRLHGQLPPGQYRIVKGATANEVRVTHWFGAEFALE